MTTQLRLVDTEAFAPAPPEARQPGTRTRRARVRTRATSTRRPARWHSEWHLDDRTRRVGQQGIAAARIALARARQSEQDLAQAS